MNFCFFPVPNSCRIFTSDQGPHIALVCIIRLRPCVDILQTATNLGVITLRTVVQLLHITLGWEG